MKKLTRHTSGISLLEVILAVAISGIITTGGIKYYVLSNYLNEKSRSHQLASIHGATTLSLLGSYIRDAGTGTNAAWSNISPIEPQTACDFPGFCSRGVDNDSDAIALRLDPQNNRACNGTLVAVNEVIINRFYVDNSDQTLRCNAYSVTNDAPIAPVNFAIQNNVESMQVEYHLSDGTSTEDTPATPSILGVTVSILVNSGIDRAVSEKTRKYRLLEANELSFTNTRELRQVYQSTFPINSAFIIGQGLQALGL